MRNTYHTMILYVFLTLIGYSQETEIQLCQDILHKELISDEEFDILDHILFNINYYLSDTPIYLYKAAIDKAKEQENYKYAGRFEIKLADLFYELSEVDSCLVRGDHAAQFLKAHGEELEYARAANIRRLAYTRKNDYLTAYDIVFEAIEIFDKYDDKIGRSITLRDIGSIKVHENKFDDALDYCLQAIPDLEAAKFWYELTFSYQRVAILNRLKGNYGAAHRYVLKAFDACRNLQGFRSNQGLAKQYWTRGYIYEAEEKYDQALAYYDSAHVFANNIGYSDIDITIKNFKGGILIKQGKYQEALEVLGQALIDTKSKQKAYDFYNPIYSNLVLAYEGLENYKVANEYIKTISNAKDSIFRINAEMQMAEMQTKYETSQKESTIALQNAKLTQQKWVLILVAGILILSIIGGIFLLRLNRALKERQQEKDLLMKEIHHRVKNNLQILSSLLSLQSDSEEDASIVGALQESKSRVESMGLIHQKLYTHDNLTAIDMGNYVDELCNQLQDSYNSHNQNIEIRNDIKVRLADVETAIPLGLIINELITNSMKYAFRNGDSGLIEVQLWEEKGQQLKLLVRDNGNFASDQKNRANATKFGSRLIEVLSRKLKGSIQVNRDEGYQTMISFERYRLN